MEAGGRLGVSGSLPVGLPVSLPVGDAGGGGENRWDLPVNMKWKPSARFGSQDRGRIGVGSGDK